MKTKLSQSAFTLLELILAVSILSVVCAAAYKLVVASTKAVSYITSDKERIRALRDVQWQLRRDLNSIIRTPKLDLETIHYPIHSLTGEYAGITINGPGRDSALHYNPQVIAYRYPLNATSPNLVRSGALPTLPIGRISEEANWKEKNVLRKITAVTFQYNDVSGDTLTSWPPLHMNANLDTSDIAAVYQAIPASIEVTIEHEQLGSLPIIIGLW